MGGVYVKEKKQKPKNPKTHTTPKTKQIKKPKPTEKPKQNPQPRKLKKPHQKTWKETGILVCVRNQYNVNNAFFLHC